MQQLELIGNDDLESSVKKIVPEDVLVDKWCLSLILEEEGRHSSRHGPFPIETKPGSELTKHLLCFSWRIRVLGNLWLVGTVFFFPDTGTGGINIGALELEGAC